MTICKYCRAACGESPFLYSTLVTSQTSELLEVFNKNSCINASPFCGHLGSAGNNYSHCARGNRTLTGGLLDGSVLSIDCYYLQLVLSGE